MNIIAKRTIEQFKAKYPDAGRQLENWYDLMRHSTFKNFIDLRHTIGSVDQVGKNKAYVCFNIKGNRYRLIVRITYPKTIFVMEFLTHNEYDKEFK